MSGPSGDHPVCTTRREAVGGIPGWTARPHPGWPGRLGQTAPLLSVPAAGTLRPLLDPDAAGSEEEDGRQD
ncbi:hypothetical protein JHN61_26505 [Streptomyces sp. MBT67]|uniref:hypothetical protein n=1 Tax=unclassified Streptomyces TaxID=2593676 RepID=UPI00190972A1|nr:MULTISPECIES: hypothetical protein [unclassified Streptomyces]MBK3532590.1 hypothetical protein [Streptomyces sp. MBT72]MBK3539708.1 hypothetical protein [Streptomyces sp. MBT67]MBK3553716.1 hypothetical protein [Streptomyces sp. MBT61]